MAGSVLISLASKILSTITSPAFSKAYEKGISIWEARDELIKLKVTIETIQVVLLDAEKKQEGSDSVQNWIKRLKGVLYNAEDLFDEVATDNLLTQQMMERKTKLKPVRVFCSKLNPIVSRNSIAKKVKAIRKTLVDISIDMAQFGFVQSHPNEPMINIREEKYAKGCSIDAKDVIGRDEDKKAILEMLISDAHVVIAIEGIGGMGKTTLAHLIYNDEMVNDFFEKKWFACISDISNEEEVLGKILQSMSEGSNTNLNKFQLEAKIRESTMGKKYLLVLDDVWDVHHGRWKNRMSLLSGGAEGSKIIVTTRLPSVVKAVGAVRCHKLKGLSDDDSWYLFKSLAFDEECEKDPRRERTGREILKRCRGVPLAIWSMGSLLYNKTIQEWEAIETEDFSDEIMSVLKLSYDHMPSNLKQCFAYCCLFPKDYRFNKHELIYLWKAQGYIELDDEESSFMNLLRWGFFQEEKKDDCGEIESCKMHDLMHDLATYVAGEESIMLSGASSNEDICPRHISLVVDDERNESWNIPASLLNVKSLRSCLLSCSSSQSSICCQKNLDQLCPNFILLRTLSLPGLGIKDIPPSIGELKLMRYLDLSANKFEDLPNSITNLVNLLALNLRGCLNLKVWPSSLRKLVNLKYLNIKDCPELRLMPEGIEKLTCLLHLSDLKVRKESELDAVDGLLQQLRGCLLLKAYCDEEEENECKWHLPVSLIRLDILDYPGKRIPGWGNNERINNLVFLKLNRCKKVRYLPPLRWLPGLKMLHLEYLVELEFMEEENNTHNNANLMFFPCLEELRLSDLWKFKGWWRKISSASSFKVFPLLSRLTIYICGELDLKSFPLCPHLRKLEYFEGKRVRTWVLHEELPSAIFCSSTSPTLEDIMIQNCQWVSSFRGDALTSLRKVFIKKCDRLVSLHLASPLLLKTVIRMCSELTSIELVETPTPSLRFLTIDGCIQLKSLHISSNLIASLEKLEITDCPRLRLLESKNKRLEQQGLVGGCSRTRVIKLDISLGDVWIEKLLSTLPSLEEISISESEGSQDGLKILHLAASPRLQRVSLKNCLGLTSVEVDAPIDIEIVGCSEIEEFPYCSTELP